MCFDIKNTNDECDFLNSFISCIMSDNEESDIDLMESEDKLFYKEVLHHDSKLRCNFGKVYHYAKSAGVNWKVAEDLDWFLFYIFHRRFGWPDLEEENGQLKVVLPDSQIRFRKSGKTEELKYKSQLVDMLDSILLWLSHQSISAMSVLMYSSAIRLASKSPVTRLHLSIRGYDWLKDNLTKDINDKLWHCLQEFLILGITDFWSRVRDASIIRLGPIIERLELSQILCLFDELVRLCDSNVNQWQIIDGAVSAICAILKRFQKVGYASETLKIPPRPEMLSSQFHYQIKVGETELDRMPPNIISRLQFLVFKLIYHPQQTIRDNAIKAFVLCLDRYYENDVDTAFQNVCQKLSSRINGSIMTTNLKCNTKNPVNGHQSYLDPYGAQSLIYLCHHLFKRLHDKINYLENWHHYHSYFDQYLSHPASSVRLVSSNLYTYAVSQAISHPLLVKNIIYHLIAKWNPDQSVLLQTINDLAKNLDSKVKKRISISKVELEKDESCSWEWREGRLLVFELLAKLIIKNHLWYTFGTTEVDSMYSSDNTNSKPNGSGLIESYSDRSYLNLCGSNSGIHNEQYRDDNDECMLSRSLDGRRFTLANFPSRMKFKAISAMSIPVIVESNEDLKRRKSHDVIFRKISEDNLISSSTNSMKNLTVAKHDVTTSTKNIHSITHYSFLVHVKEMENIDTENCNSKITIANKNESKLPTFRSLLSQMLHTSAESIIDSQWELRRMAKQALPPLGEVLRWFDPELLVNIINTHLKFEPTLMTSVCLQLLHDSLLHTSRLKLLTTNPPSSWQPNIASRVVDNIITSVELNLPQWMKSCQHYLDRSIVFDCITPHTINIVITCISNYFHIIPVSSLSKGLAEAFVRLDKAIKGYGSNFIRINNFELYPNPSNVSSSDCTALDYAVQLIDSVKQSLLGWWQKLSTPVAIRDHYDQHKEAIISCAKLMSIFASWIHPVSEMRGDSTRYIRDIHKLIGFLSKLLIEVMKIDKTTAPIFAMEFSQLLDVLSAYVQYKNIKLDFWWMRQLTDVIFMWMEEFTALELDAICQTDRGEQKSIFLSTLRALLHRLHSTNSHRRATICSTQAVHQPTPFNSTLKRHSIDDHSTSLDIGGMNFMRQENESNLELFSSQATNSNVEYISDESLNDSDGEKKIGFYRESHVLSVTSMPIQALSLTSSADVNVKKHCSLLSGKSNSSLVFEEHDSRKRDLVRSSSSINSDSGDTSDWDSSTESDEAAEIIGSKTVEKSNSEAILISDLISRFITYNPALYEQSKSLLSDIDVTILHGLKL